MSRSGRDKLPAESERGSDARTGEEEEEQCGGGTRFPGKIAVGSWSNTVGADRECARK